MLAQAQALLSTEQRIEMLRTPTGWQAVVCLALTLLVVYGVIRTYRRETRAGWSVRARTVLGALRCCVLLALLVIWMEPVLATYFHRRIESYTLVLADTSASMGLADASRDLETGSASEDATGTGITSTALRRIDLLGRVLGEPHSDGLIGRLRERNGVKLLAVADTALLLNTWPSVAAQRIAGSTPGVEADDDLSDTPAPLEATGVATDLGRSLERAIQSVSGAPISGVVLLSDGAVNRGRAPDQIASFARTRNIPIYTIGIGDPDPPVNLRVRGLEAPQAAFAGDPIELTAQIQADGLADEEIVVTLYVETGTGRGAEVQLEQRRLHITDDAWSGPVGFRQAIDRAGRAVFRVEAESARPETTLDDNTYRAQVVIQDNRIRVLLLSSSPSWEYRALARLLERDESVDVSCWLQSASRDAVRDGNTIIDHLPASREELNEYGVVVLLDPRPDELTRDWGAWINAWVADGAGGLIYCAGRKYSPRFVRDAAMADILELLPVVIHDDSILILNQLGHYQKNAWPLQIPDAAQDHPILRQAETREANRAVWDRLSGTYWHFPVHHEKPLAAVLMRHGNPQMRNSYGSHVLFAVQLVGTGRTGFLAFDATWRWRRSGEEYFNRFWINTLRFLIEGKLSRGRRRADLRIERDTYQLGESVRVRGRFLDEQFAPLSRSSIAAVLSSGDREEKLVELLPTPDRPGWYQATLIPNRTGIHQVRVEIASDSGGEPAEDFESFLVAAPNVEMADPRLNREALRTIAEGSGGAYFDLADWEQVPAMLADRHEELVVAGKPIALWDRWYTLCLLGGLLTVEWALRKKARLL